MNLESIKALFSNALFKKNAVQVIAVLIAAVTGAILADRIDASQPVETIETNEVL